MELKLKDFIDDAIEGASEAAMLRALGVDGSEYVTALTMVLVNVCRRLGITEKDDVNTRVQECLFALGLEAKAKPKYLELDRD